MESTVTCESVELVPESSGMVTHGYRSKLTSATSPFVYLMVTTDQRDFVTGNQYKLTITTE
jgi:hypothetical protein